MRYALAIAAVLAPLGFAQAAESEAAKASPLLIGSAPLRLEDLRETRDRPLFSSTRRPPPAADGAVLADPQTSETSAAAPFELLGAVRGEHVSYVLLRNRATHEVKRFETDEEADGWKLGAIGYRSVELKRDGRVQTLTLGNPVAVQVGSASQFAGAASANSVSSNEGAAQIGASPPQTEYDRLMRKLNLQATPTSR